jgi:hypothetical protein
MQDDEEGWIAEFEASGESELRDRLYRGSGMHPEAKFSPGRSLATRAGESAQILRRDVRRTLWAAVAAVLVGIVGIGIALLR